MTSLKKIKENQNKEELEKLQVEFQHGFSKMFPEKVSEGQEDIVSKNITFVVTTSCSLACTYCYEINKGQQKMSFEVAKKAIDKLLSGEDGFKDYVDTPSIILEFIGGEPLLEIELIDQIVDYFREQAILLRHPWAENYCLSICSNGVAYNELKVQEFLRKNKRHLSFSITIDGTKELHDSCRIFPDGSPSYNIAHDAAMDWVNKGNYMGSKITMAPSNIKYTADCLKQMLYDGYRKINMNPVYEEGWTKKDAKIVYKQCKEFTDWALENEIYPGEHFDISFFSETFGKPMEESENDNWCGGNCKMLTIGPDGTCYPCLRYMPMSLGRDREPIIIGNVDKGIAKTKAQKDLIKDMQKITRKSQSTEECFNCPIAKGCSWCSAYNYQVTGSYDKRVTYICDIHKARVLASCYLWNKTYQKLKKNEVYDLHIPKEWALEIISEEEYNKLVELTKSLDGYVNESN